MMESALRVMIVGDWRWAHYEQALASGLGQHGCVVEGFQEYSSPESIRERVEQKLRSGKGIRDVRERLVRDCARFKPDLLFLYSCDLVDAKTVTRIRSTIPPLVVFAYHNDNPFRNLRRRLIWRHFMSTLRVADMVFVYRPENVVQALNRGACRVELLLPSYVSELHQPYENPSSGPDVVFVGHYESDGRAEVIEAMVSGGLDVELYGAGWEKAPRSCVWVRGQAPEPLMGEAYARKLSDARIALVFLSRHNRDVWTRRCFEIPACGTLMLAPRTVELENLFEDGREALYFDDRDSAVHLAKRYVVDAAAREEIAARGMQRVRARDSEISRARQVIEFFEAIYSSRKTAGEQVHSGLHPCVGLSQGDE